MDPFGEFDEMKWDQEDEREDDADAGWEAGVPAGWDRPRSEPADEPEMPFGGMPWPLAWDIMLGEWPKE